jgi:hypothetical protein
LTTEQDKIRKWNRENFKRILPEEESEVIDTLVSNEVSYHDLERLIDLGCDKKLAVQILV